MYIDWSSLATAAVGLIGIVGVTITATSHLRGIAMKSFLEARLDAFEKYESAFYALSISRKPDDAAAIYHATNVVVLVASDATIEKISKVQEMIRAWQTGKSGLDVEALGKAHVAVLFEMHQDLLTYPRSRRESKQK